MVYLVALSEKPVQFKKIEVKLMVDPEPTKVGTLKGSEGPLVIFFKFFAVATNFLVFCILKVNSGSF